MGGADTHYPHKDCDVRTISSATTITVIVHDHRICFLAQKHTRGKTTS